MAILALYRGNSNPGQLVDSSGNGYDLTQPVGAVNNPSSPTPPEGDRWLEGNGIAAADYLKTPTDAPIFGGTQGSLNFYYQVTSNGAGNNNFLAFKSAGVLLGKASILIGRIVFQYRRADSPSSTQNFFPSGTIPINTTGLVSFRWNASGTELYRDGILLASSPNLLHATPPTEIRIGGQGDLGSEGNSNGFYDMLQFSNVPGEVFPPVNFTPALLAARRARR